MKRGASPNFSGLSPEEKRPKLGCYDQVTAALGLPNDILPVSPLYNTVRHGVPFQQVEVAPPFPPMCLPMPRPNIATFRDAQRHMFDGHQDNYISPPSAPNNMSPSLGDLNRIPPADSRFVSPTIHYNSFISPANSLSTPSDSTYSYVPTSCLLNSKSITVSGAPPIVGGTSVTPSGPIPIPVPEPTPQPSPSSPPSAKKRGVSERYSHYKAVIEFQQTREKGEPITIDSSPTFARCFRNTTRANITASSISQPQALNRSTVPPSVMQQNPRYSSSDMQQPAQTGPIRTSASRDAYPSHTQSRRHYRPHYQSISSNVSPTGSTFDHDANFAHSHSHGRHYNESHEDAPSPTHYARRRHPMSPLPRMPGHSSYHPPPLPAANRPSPYQHLCLHGESSASSSTQHAVATGVNMAPPMNPLPAAPTWATKPGSGPLPLPHPPHPPQPRRPATTIRPTHASGFLSISNYSGSQMAGANFRPSKRSTQSPTPLPAHAARSPSTVRAQPPISPKINAESSRGPAIATRPSASPTPLLSRCTTLSASLSPTPPTALTAGNNNHSLNQAPEKMVSHLQVLAAHIGLDVQFTRKRSPPPAGGLPFKRSRSKTPEPHRGIIPKLSPPRTSSGKNTRRQSFAALLPGGRGAPPKRSRPGQWTLEKRLIFVDRLLTAGYKALCLTDLAEELKKKQLVNQLTPGRTGSIRELCMNAAARLHDHCTDCKKKQAVAKRKADRDGLADFLLRGASECVGDEEEEELNGNDSLEEDELMDEEPENEEKNE